MKEVVRGTDILADNWLFQVVAGFISGNDDPNDSWGWIGVDKYKTQTIEGEIKAGVFQLDCLVNLIEQLVFTNSINVIGSWTPSWSHLNTRLNSLLNDSNEQFIIPVEFSEKHQEETDYWLKTLLTNQSLEEKVTRGIQDFRNRVENSPYKFWSQIVNATAQYLALAEELNLTYSPHTARSGFLRSGKWQSTISNLQTIPPGQRKFKDLIDKRRIRLQKKIRPTDVLNQMSISLPSIAMLCIAESSEVKSPIDVAMELRNNSEMKNLRMFLHELTRAANENLLPDIEKQEKFMKEVIKNVENELRDIKKIEPNQNPTEISLDYFHCRQIDDKNGIATVDSRKHSGLISQLLLTSSRRTDMLIREKLRIDHSMMDQYRSWVKGDYFKKSKQQIVIKKAKIHHGDKYKGNIIKVEPGATISGTTINQSYVENQSDKIDFKEVRHLLKELLDLLEKNSTNDQQNKDCLRVKSAISDIEKGDHSKALKTLRKTGKWTVNIASQIGVSLLTEILKGNIS